jgi:ribosomal protein L24E
VGTWETLETAVWETNVTPCECCGQIVAKRLWTVDVGGRTMRFCSPACEELYRTYVLPRQR